MRNLKRNLIGGAMAAVTLASSVMPAFAAGNVTMGQDNKGNGDTTVTGTVSPINTMDVTVDITGISFFVDTNAEEEADRLTSQGTVIKSNTPIALDVNVLSASQLDAGDTTGGLAATTMAAPALVANSAYTDKEWDNMTVAQTKAEIAIAIKQVDVENGAAGEALTEATVDALKVATPVELGVLSGSGNLIAHLESAYSEETSCALNLEKSRDYTDYGKAWIGADDVVFRYATVLEFVFDEDGVH